MANTNITIRIDEELKTQLQDLMSDLGMDVTTFFIVTAKQAVREQALPFNPRITDRVYDKKYQLSNGNNDITLKWYIENLMCKIKLQERDYLKEYTEKDYTDVINSIMLDSAIGTIVITEDNELLEGYKRILAINQFVNGKYKYNDKFYTELSDEEKDKFDGYLLMIAVV